MLGERLQVERTPEQLREAHFSATPTRGSVARFVLVVGAMPLAKGLAAVG